MLIVDSGLAASVSVHLAIIVVFVCAWILNPGLLPTGAIDLRPSIRNRSDVGLTINGITSLSMVDVKIRGCIVQA